jgi:hypothetical protein
MPKEALCMNELRLSHQRKYDSIEFEIIQIRVGDQVKQFHSEKTKLGEDVLKEKGSRVRRFLDVHVDYRELRSLFDLFIYFAEIRFRSEFTFARKPKNSNSGVLSDEEDETKNSFASLKSRDAKAMHARKPRMSRGI